MAVVLLLIYLKLVSFESFFFFFSKSNDGHIENLCDHFQYLASKLDLFGRRKRLRIFYELFIFCVCMKKVHVKCCFEQFTEISTGQTREEKKKEIPQNDEVKLL